MCNNLKTKLNLSTLAENQKTKILNPPLIQINGIGYSFFSF